MELTEAQASTGLSARRRPIDAALVALVVVGVLATIACLVATRDRLGYETDSGPYLGAAYNLAHGRGVSTPFTFFTSAYGPRRSLAFGDAVPLTDFPPLFPAVVGALGAVGVPMVQAIRFLYALLLGVNVVLVGLLFLAVTKGRGRSIAVAVPALLLLGPTSANFAAAGRVNWLTLHGSVLSEPLFITLVLTTLLLVSRYLHSASRAALIGAIATAALAVLTRNIGVALVAAASVTILLGGGRRRLPTAATFAMLGLAPAVAWNAVQILGQGGVGPRPFDPHSGSGTGKDLLDAVEKWLFPSPWHATARHALLLVVVLAVVALGWVQRRRDTLASGPTLLLLVFAATYVVVLVASRLLVDVNAIDERMLAPLQPVIYVLAAAWIWSGLRALAPPRVATAAVLGVVAVLMLVSARPIVSFVREGFPEVPTSATALAVGRLPPGIVFANLPAQIWITSGRSTYQLPRQRNPFTGERNPHYESELRELAAVAAERPTAIVLVDSIGFELFPTVDDLERRMDVRSVAHYADGVIAVVGGRDAASTALSGRLRRAVGAPYR